MKKEEMIIRQNIVLNMLINILNQLLLNNDDKKHWEYELMSGGKIIVEEYKTYDCGHGTDTAYRIWVVGCIREYDLFDYVISSHEIWNRFYPHNHYKENWKDLLFIGLIEAWDYYCDEMNKDTEHTEYLEYHYSELDEKSQIISHCNGKPQYFCKKEWYDE